LNKFTEKCADCVTICAHFSVWATAKRSRLINAVIHNSEIKNNEEVILSERV